MIVPLKYAVVERERRWLVSRVPEGVVEVLEIRDRYVDGTRLRLREVRHGDGTVVRKLTQKVRLEDGPRAVACTNVYLDDAEWGLLVAMPGREASKRRHVVERDGRRLAVDQYEEGTLVAELDDGDADPLPAPKWLAVVREVTDDETFTGAGLARSPRAGR